MLARRRELAPGSAEAAADATRQLLAEPAVRRAAKLALYAGLPDELPTRLLFETLRAAGRTCLLPRVAAPGEGLRFARVERWEELEPAPGLGILEPPLDAPEERPASGDVAIVPGVAFDARGARLGRGAGFYDRTFPPGAPDAPLLLGLAWHFQLVERVPAGSRDRRMDAIVTERGVRWSGAGGE